LDRGERASNLTLMLPVTLQFIIVMVDSAVNDRLQRKLDYVDEERRIPREQLDAATDSKKLSLTADRRRRLAAAGKPWYPKTCRHSSLWGAMWQLLINSQMRRELARVS
jgi:hypothetical protein